MVSSGRKRQARCPNPVYALLHHVDEATLYGGSGIKEASAGLDGMTVAK